jgi:ZIP family zinc transporter
MAITTSPPVAPPPGSPQGRISALHLGAAWRLQARLKPWTTAGLALAAVTVLVMFGQSLWRIAQGEADAALRLGMLGGLIGFASTALGALPALVLQRLDQRAEDSLLGLAAGMMLAASSFSLLLPGIEAGSALTGNASLGAGVVITGMALGVLLMLGLDQFTPHEHPHGGACGPGFERINRVWLFVFAIILHNLPEGMAIGVSFSQGDLGVGVPLTAAIALQNLPEGLAVAMALRAIGLGAWPAVAVAAFSGVMEPVGALLGLGLSSGLTLAYPVGLGLAAGAMIFVVSHEVIPETHRNGHQTLATLGLMTGFALMTVLDTALG